MRRHAQAAARRKEEHSEPAELVAVQRPETDAVGIGGKVPAEQGNNRVGSKPPAIAAWVMLIIGVIANYNAPTSDLYVRLRSGTLVKSRQPFGMVLQHRANAETCSHIKKSEKANHCEG